MEESPEIEEFESQIMEKENIKQEIPGLYIYKRYRLLDSLVVECLLRVREVQGSIPSQGPRHTKDVIKMVPAVSLFSTQH